MQHKRRPAPLSPQPIFDDFLAAWRTQALITAVELDLFGAIAAGKRTAAEISNAADTSVRGTQLLLDALVGMGYLRKAGRGYALMPLAAQFLVKGKDSYAADRAGIVRNHWDTWGRLAEAVKTGRAVLTVNDTERGKEFFPELVKALFRGNFAASRTVLNSLTEKNRRGIKHILDVGAGSGAWSLAFAQALPGVRVTAIDLPEVIRVTREYARNLGVADRYSYQEGDFHRLDFGRDEYDVAILGHILHGEGETGCRDLLRKCHTALRTGGMLLIAEQIANDARTGPLMPLLFGLNMLLHTEEGNVYTMREYRVWLKAAGFRKLATVQAQAPSPLILATK